MQFARSGQPYEKSTAVKPSTQLNSSLIRTVAWEAKRNTEMKDYDYNTKYNGFLSNFQLQLTMVNHMVNHGKTRLTG